MNLPSGNKLLPALPSVSRVVDSVSSPLGKTKNQRVTCYRLAHVHDLTAIEKRSLGNIFVELSQNLAMIDALAV